MRKVMSLIGAFATVVAVNAQEVETVPFTGTCINVPARVRFVRGNDYSFNVSSGNAELVRQLQCSVKDGILNFKFGKTVEPGNVVFDEKNGTYFYGVNTAGELAYEEGDGNDELLITVTAPGMPEIKTSRDFKAVPVKEMGEVAGKSLAFNK